MNPLSVGEICDKLIIETIKIALVREKIHFERLTPKQHVEFYQSMNVLNQNRAILMNLLDDKLDAVIDGREKNRLLKVVKTY